MSIVSYVLLFDLEIQGFKIQVSSEDISVLTSGGSRLFRGKVVEFSMSDNIVNLSLENAGRYQDLEIRRYVDAGTATVYRYPRNGERDGVLLEDCEIMLKGWLEKVSHTKSKYNLKITPLYLLSFGQTNLSIDTCSPSAAIRKVIQTCSSLTVNDYDLSQIEGVLDDWKITAEVNDKTDAWSMIERISGKTSVLPYYPVMPFFKNGKLSFAYMDLVNPVPLTSLDEDIDIIGDVEISKTEPQYLGNDFIMNFGYSTGSSGFTAQAIRNKDSSEDCKLSVGYYGISIPMQIDCTFTGDVNTAVGFLDWVTKFCTFRHDILTCSVSLDKSFINVGDYVKVTHSLGPSFDGYGWVDEVFLVLERSLGLTSTNYRLWKYNVLKPAAMRIINWIGYKLDGTFRLDGTRMLGGEWR